MKFFKIEHGSLYLFQSENAYWEIYSEYGQFLRPKSYNWINFTFFNFDIEYSKFVGNTFCIQLGLLGITTRFHWMISENEGTEELENTLDDIKTTTEANLEEKVDLLDWVKTILPKKGVKTTISKLDSKIKTFKKDLKKSIKNE